MRRSWTSSIVPDLAEPSVLADQTTQGWKRPFDNPIVLPDAAVSLPSKTLATISPYVQRPINSSTSGRPRLNA